MADFGRSLAGSLVGRCCVVGVGNVERADDGVGVFVAETLAGAGIEDVIVAGTTPERWMTALAAGTYDTVLFVDAVGLDADPGSAVLMDAQEIEARFPQVSTHRISLGTLARLVGSEAGARVLLLGVRPGTLAERRGLTPVVEETARALAAILVTILAEQSRVTLDRGCLSAAAGAGVSPALRGCEA
jgi:hydrogenase maturation protease